MTRYFYIMSNRFKAYFTRYFCKLIYYKKTEVKLMEIKIEGQVSEEEKEYCLKQIQEKNPDKIITSLTIKQDGDYLDCSYHYQEKNFERIRRITGYLVGTLDRFNNAKKAEVHDRVKHNRYSDASELAN